LGFRVSFTGITSYAFNIKLVIINII